jgi:hypothetical protein
MSSIDEIPVPDNIEEGIKAPEESAVEAPVKKGTSRNKLYALGVIVFIAIVLAVVIPTALIVGDDDETTTASLGGTDTSGTGGTSTGGTSTGGTSTGGTSTGGTSTGGTGTGGTGTGTSTPFVEIDGAFKLNVTLFGEDIVRERYSNLEDFQGDVENAGRFFVNSVSRSTSAQCFNKYSLARPPKLLTIPVLPKYFCRLSSVTRM